MSTGHSTILGWIYNEGDHNLSKSAGENVEVQSPSFTRRYSEDMNMEDWIVQGTVYF